MEIDEMRFEIFIIPETDSTFELGAIGEQPNYDINQMGARIEQFNLMIDYIKENYDRIYYDGMVDWSDDVKEQLWFKCTFVCKNKLLLNFIKQNDKIIFHNKQEMENIMSKNKAPYQLWSPEALKNECKARKFDDADYKDVTDKAVLVELLKQDDASQIEKKVDKPEIEKKVDKPKIEKKVDKPKVEKKTLADLKSLNSQLRDKGLWVKGAQFLSNSEKQQLLKAKNQKERDVVYNLLEVKMKEIAITLSEKMKAVAAAKKIETQVEEKKNVVEDDDEIIEDAEDYGDKSLNELKKIAIARKDELKAKGLSAKKSDSIEQLTNKLIKADAITS